MPVASPEPRAVGLAIGTATNDAARPQGPMMGGPSRLIRFPNRTNATNSEGARK